MGAGQQGIKHVEVHLKTWCCSSFPCTNARLLLFIHDVYREKCTRF